MADQTWLDCEAHLHIPTCSILTLIILITSIFNLTIINFSNVQYTGINSESMKIIIINIKDIATMVLVRNKRNNWGSRLPLQNSKQHEVKSRESDTSRLNTRFLLTHISQLTFFSRQFFTFLWSLCLSNCTLHQNCDVQCWYVSWWLLETDASEWD